MVVLFISRGQKRSVDLWLRVEPKNTPKSLGARKGRLLLVARGGVGNTPRKDL